MRYGKEMMQELRVVKNGNPGHSIVAGMVKIHDLLLPEKYSNVFHNALKIRDEIGGELESSVFVPKKTGAYVNQRLPK